jgi:hypothetical protein
MATGQGCQGLALCDVKVVKAPLLSCLVVNLLSSRKINEMVPAYSQRCVCSEINSIGSGSVCVCVWSY